MRRSAGLGSLSARCSLWEGLGSGHGNFFQVLEAAFHFARPDGAPGPPRSLATCSGLFGLEGLQGLLAGLQASRTAGSGHGVHQEDQSVVRLPGGDPVQFLLAQGQEALAQVLGPRTLRGSQAQRLEEGRQGQVGVLSLFGQAGQPVPGQKVGASRRGSDLEQGLPKRLLPSFGGAAGPAQQQPEGVGGAQEGHRFGREGPGTLRITLLGQAQGRPDPATGPTLAFFRTLRGGGGARLAVRAQEGGPGLLEAAGLQQEPAQPLGQGRIGAQGLALDQG